MNQPRAKRVTQVTKVEPGDLIVVHENEDSFAHFVLALGTNHDSFVITEAKTHKVNIVHLIVAWTPLELRVILSHNYYYAASENICLLKAERHQE